MWQHLHLRIVDGMVANLRFPCCLPSLLLVALDPIVTPRGSSTMILRLRMGCMGLCSICSGRHNPRKREGVLVKDYKLGGRWVIWIGIVGLGLDTKHCNISTSRFKV